MTRNLWAALVVAAVMTGCGMDPDDDGDNNGGGGGNGDDTPATVVAVAQSNADFSILVSAVTKAGLAAELSNPSGNFTVFAPTNAAFTALFAALGVTNGVDGLSVDPLRPILRYHVLGARVPASAATSAAQGNAKVDALGGKIQLSLDGQTIRLDDRARVTAADLQADNGVVHVIDAVLLPSITDIATTDSRFSSLTAALVRADEDASDPDLVATLDDDQATFTVFAPTNAAFDTLVSALKGSDDGATTGINGLTSFRPSQLIPVLTYHVIGDAVMAADVPASAIVDTLGGRVAVTRSGGNVMVDGVAVAVPDVLASNGVIHGIGSVLLPSITDVVTTSPRFTALKGAVLAADGADGTSPKVASALDGTAKFTFFAPSNAAFDALGTPPAGQALTDVLLYHAVPGDPIYAAAALALSGPTSFDTALAGNSVDVNAEGDPKGVTVTDDKANEADVTAVNYFTSNGVIHVIDRVLLP